MMNSLQLVGLGSVDVSGLWIGKKKFDFWGFDSR